MCRCDFLCSNAVVQFVWLGVSFGIGGGGGGGSGAYVVVL